jgi:hypothetical protein
MLEHIQKRNIPAVSLSCTLYTLLLQFAFLVLHPGIKKKCIDIYNGKGKTFRQVTFSF